MDTISVKVAINYKGMVTMDTLNYIRHHINKIASPYGYAYCDVLEINEKREFIVKISYPRFFAGINAYLITTSEECIQVQRHLVNSLRLENLLHEVGSISLMRVDIPFTYLMSEGEFFYNYHNIFRVFAMVYQQKNGNANPKMISQIISGNVETLNYADTKSISNYNSKVMVYNQYQNLMEKSEYDVFQGIIERFPDLSHRIRIEVSKRISRTPFTLESFGNFNIYKEYRDKYKAYLLCNFFDFKVIDKIYEDEAIVLATELMRVKQDPRFKYEVFILNNIKGIFDYKILKKALEIVIDNQKTREGAITTVRKILRGYEQKNGLIVLDTYSHIKEMQKQLEV